MKTKTRVRIPQITSLETAIELYLKKSELSSEDIKTLFGDICKDRVVKLKRLAREKIAEKGVMVWNPRYVNTAAAYEAWGLDINDLERRYRKLKEFQKGA